jgi:hypothetical protein
VINYIISVVLWKGLGIWGGGGGWGGAGWGRAGWGREGQGGAGGGQGMVMGSRQ